MTVSPAEPADFVIRRKYRLYDLAISLATCALFMLVVGIRGGLTWFAVLVVHEFGHFALGLRYTGRAPAIVIYPFLGLTLAPGMSRRPTRENIAFALGGIWLSVLVALPLLATARHSDLALGFLGVSLAVNSINALPIPGLDGGRVCSALSQTLPAPWPRVMGLALFGFAVIVAYVLKDPVLWAVTGLVALISLVNWIRRARVPIQALAPRDAVAWLAAYLLTLTVVVHLLWIVLSEPHAIFRMMEGLGLA